MMRSSTLLMLAAALVAEDTTLTIGVTRLEAAAVDQPFTIYQVSGDTYQREAGAKAVDALAVTPAVFVQRTAGNQASPFLRGLTGEQTLLLFDGVRMNHAMNRSGPNQYSALLPPNSIERIDVVLGTSGVTQGSDGLTGAVDFRLAPAGRGVTAVASPWISGRGDYADGYRTSGGLDGLLKGGIAYTLEGGYTATHDRRGGKDAGDHLFFDAAGDRDIPNSGYRQSDGAARFAFTELPGQRLELSLGRTRQFDAPRADGYSENSGRTINTGAATRPSDISREFDEQTFNYLHGRHVIGNAAEIARLQTTVWYHDWYEEEIREDLQAGNNNASTADDRYRRRENQNRIQTRGVDLQVGKSFGSHQATLGGTWYRDVTTTDFQRYRTAAGVLTPGTETLSTTADQSAAVNATVPDGAVYDSQAVFLQDQWLITSDWELVGGVRLTRVHWDFEATKSRYLAAPTGTAFTESDRFSKAVSAPTGELRLGWHPLVHTTIYGGVSQGFRAPNLTNLAGLTTRASANTTSIPNADLKPEKSLTYEIGGKWQDGRDHASIALFVTTISDLIQTQYQDTNGDGSITAADTATVGNAEKGQLAGIEIGHDLGLPIHLPVGQRLAVIQAASAVTGEAEQPTVVNGRKAVEEVHISRANRIWGSFGLRYEPSPAWYLLAQVRWSAAYDEVNPGDATDVRHTTFAAKGGDAGAMPGYAVSDLKAGWKSAGGGIRVDAAVENLGDVSYRDPGSGIDGTGLNAILATTLRY